MRLHPFGHDPFLAKSSWLKERSDVLTSKTGATMETDLEETTAGWVARYLIVSKGFGRMGPHRA